jgi:hypothetical protein
MPTKVNLHAMHSEVADNDSFDFTIINNGGKKVDLKANIANLGTVTLIGVMTITNPSTAHFKCRLISGGSYVLYRM